MTLIAFPIQALRIFLVIALAILPATPKGASWWVLTGLGTLILISELCSTLMQRANSNKMEKIQQRALRVIADLSYGTGARHDVWVVDIYLPRLSWPTSKGIRILKRTISLSLTDVQNVPPEVALSDDEPLARCYKYRKRLLWVDSRYNTAHSTVDALSSKDDEKLRNTYGAVSINPLVDNTGHKCRGILLVHTKPDPELVTTAVGILDASRGRRHIDDASHDIHGHLA